MFLSFYLEMLAMLLPSPLQVMSPGGQRGVFFSKSLKKFCLFMLLAGLATVANADFGGTTVCAGREPTEGFFKNHSLTQIFIYEIKTFKNMDPSFSSSSPFTSTSFLHLKFSVGVAIRIQRLEDSFCELTLNTESERLGSIHLSVPIGNLLVFSPPPRLRPSRVGVFPKYSRKRFGLFDSPFEGDNKIFFVLGPTDGPDFNFFPKTPETREGSICSFFQREHKSSLQFWSGHVTNSF